MSENNNTSLDKKVLSIPVVAVLVIAFLSVSGAVGFVISMYDTYMDAKDESHKAVLAKCEAEKSKEEQRLTGELERIKISESFKAQYLTACQSQLKAKADLISSLSNTIPPPASTQTDSPDLKKCNEEVAIFQRKNRINETRIETLNAEISKLKIDQVKAGEAFRQELVHLTKKREPVTAIGEVDIVLKEVTNKKLNVDFDYTIYNKKYSAEDIPQKTIVGRRIGSFLYLFEILESSSTKPESATINVIRVSSHSQTE